MTSQAEASARLVRGVFVLALAGAAGLPAAAGAEPNRYTVDEAVEAALRDNPLMDAAQAEIDVFEARLDQAWGRYVPKLEVRGIFTMMPAARGDALYGYTDTDEWGPLVRLDSKASMPLYAFGQLSALRDAARAGIDIAWAKHAMAEAELAWLTRQAWYGWQFAEAAIEVIDEGKGYLDRARRRLEQLEEDFAPEFDPIELMKLKVHEATVLERRADADKGRAVAREGLMAALALPRTADIALADGDVEPVGVELLDVDGYLAVAMAFRPTVRILDARIEEASAKEAKELAQFFPTIGLDAFHRFYWSPIADDQKSPFAQDSYNDHQAGVGLSLTWKIDIGQQLGRYQEAGATIRKAVAEREAFALRTRAEVADALREVERQRAVHAIHAKAFKAARSWLMAKSDLYDTGFATLDEVSSALVEFYAQKIGLLESAYAFNLAVARLSYTVGTDVRALVPADEPGPAAE